MSPTCGLERAAWLVEGVRVWRLAAEGEGGRSRGGDRVGEEGREDRGEDRGEGGGGSMPSSTTGGSSASAATAASMSPLKSKVGLAGVTQEENATPERVWREL
jgi:hypothetical protein